MIFLYVKRQGAEAAFVSLVSVEQMQEGIAAIAVRAIPTVRSFMFTGQILSW